MARRSRTAVLKRQRERKKAEKAEIKREQKAMRKEAGPADGSQVASADDLVAYGLAEEEPEAEPEEEERG